MQNAKDTFYVTLRDRLAVANPQRTIVVRGISRPGLLVEENELATTFLPSDAFSMRWTETSVDVQGPLPLVALTCEFQYTTDGGSEVTGLDRGRKLSAMDGELLDALRMAPRHIVKMNYTSASPTPMGTDLFWGDLTFTPVEISGDSLGRRATIQVFSYREEGEL